MTKNKELHNLVIKQRRFDILAQIMGFEPQGFHLRMIEWQDIVSRGQLLGFPGCGKSTYCTIIHSIGELLCDKSTKILIASKTKYEAEPLLDGINTHLEKNTRLKDVFGSVSCEKAITVAGVGNVLSKNKYDIIIGDDIVGYRNSSTQKRRMKVRTWYDQSLIPALKPRGRMWTIGTLLRVPCLYTENSEASTIRFPALDDDDRSVWENCFSTKELHRKRQGGFVLFDMQYMCRAPA